MRDKRKQCADCLPGTRSAVSHGGHECPEWFLFFFLKCFFPPPLIAVTMKLSPKQQFVSQEPGRVGSVEGEGVESVRCV